jgi:hypothetical protein
MALPGFREGALVDVLERAAVDLEIQRRLAERVIRAGLLRRDRWEA